MLIETSIVSRIAPLIPSGIGSSTFLICAESLILSLMLGNGIGKVSSYVGKFGTTIDWSKDISFNCDAKSIFSK